MAYTTEEQDFASFMSKLRQLLPLILTAVFLGVATYSLISWWKNHAESQKVAEYQEYKRIMSIQNDGTTNDDVRSEMLLKYLNDHPKKALAAIGVINQVKYLSEGGKYEQALKLVSAIPDNNEFSPELVAITKAKLLLQVGRGEEGIPALDKVKNGPWYVDARALAGDIYFAALKYDQSYAEYNKAKSYLLNLTNHADANTNTAGLQEQLGFIQNRLNIVQSASKNGTSEATTSESTTEQTEQSAPASGN
ncbi:tetratricopeptide repeat protein [Psittacicella hinzii]|uniref:Ancillary SecYEG translocon subunit n=1 Tax=Psittacicella hinzii TaxID=2028575 RepID=A0A3A1YPS0_9GAMM|nr:tetratricopeptide repeat protein [Psittacicella hinzii]RIY38960.1 hypothetical protein CKF58_03075 [Psittacicella hinzii]